MRKDCGVRRLPRLLDEFALSHWDGCYPRIFRSLSRALVPILDNWVPECLSEFERRDLMEVVKEPAAMLDRGYEPAFYYCVA